MILVCGEALIDLTPDPASLDDAPRFIARAGGSPANVAVALARLGAPAAFLGKLSRDPLGRHLHDHLDASGVDLRYTSATDDPSTMVVVSTDLAGEPAYGFYTAGTASSAMVPADIPDALPAGIAAIHIGSISLELEPTATTLEAFVARERHGRVVVLDPNVRPSVIADRDDYRRRLREWIASADIVKASEADLAWLEPDAGVSDVATAWQRMGPALVVVTLGGDGALGVSTDGILRVPAPSVRVVDTVGAGDAFSAGFLHALWTTDRLSPAALRQLPATALESALMRGNTIAADTCTRPGADPPWSTDPDVARERTNRGGSSR
jgi:fructokinase